jgi:hypothetical protein
MRRPLTLLVSTLLLACRGESGPPNYQKQMDQYIPEVERAVGLKFRTPPKLEVKTRDEVKAFLLANVQDSNTVRELDGQTALFHALQLVPDTLDLKKLFVPLLGEQIIGYYYPKTKVLYVVDGAPKDYVGFTIMHELVHALQDQYINLDSLEKLTHDSDRQSAMQTVIEGQATFEQAVLMSGGEGALSGQLPGGWQQIQDMIRQASTTQPVFASAPVVVQEALLFPYVNGADFVRRYRQRNKGPMRYDSLPQSTEQILHDDAYFTKKDPPVEVVLPPVPGQIYQNNLGEFGIRLFLYKHLKDIKTSASAAAGWAGDRYAVVKTAQGPGAEVVAAWDTPTDAAEYVSALTQMVGKRFGDSTGTIPPAQKHETPTDRRYDVTGRTIAIVTRSVGGRTVVAYAEVPAGAGANLIDLSRVILR